MLRALVVTFAYSKCATLLLNEVSVQEKLFPWGKKYFSHEYICDRLFHCFRLYKIPFN